MCGIVLGRKMGQAWHALETSPIVPNPSLVLVLVPRLCGCVCTPVWWEAVCGCVCVYGQALDVWCDYRRVLVCNTLLMTQ